MFWHTAFQAPTLPIVDAGKETHAETSRKQASFAHDTDSQLALPPAPLHGAAAAAPAGKPGAEHGSRRQQQRPTQRPNAQVRPAGLAAAFLQRQSPENRNGRRRGACGSSSASWRARAKLRNRSALPSSRSSDPASDPMPRVLAVVTGASQRARSGLCGRKACIATAVLRARRKRRSDSAAALPTPCPAPDAPATAACSLSACSPAAESQLRHSSSRRSRRSSSSRQRQQHHGRGGLAPL